MSARDRVGEEEGTPRAKPSRQHEPGDLRGGSPGHGVAEVGGVSARVPGAGTQLGGGRQGSREVGGPRDSAQSHGGWGRGAAQAGGWTAPELG